MIKSYDNDDSEDARRYGPAKCTGVQKYKVMGRPNLDKATTSYIENLNLMTRQRCRRFGRLTNMHSKKESYHRAAVALNFFAHNFMRVHSPLTAQAGKRTTPAMMHRLATRPWTADDLVRMLDPEAVTIE